MATYNQWSFQIGSNYRGDLQVSLLKRTYEDGREIGFDLQYLSRPLTASALEFQVQDAMHQVMMEWFGDPARKAAVTGSR